MRKASGRAVLSSWILWAGFGSSRSRATWGQKMKSAQWITFSYVVYCVYFTVFHCHVSKKRWKKSGSITTVFIHNFPDKWCWRAALPGELLELPSALLYPVHNAINTKLSLWKIWFSKNPLPPPFPKQGWTIPGHVCVCGSVLKPHLSACSHRVNSVQWRHIP